MHPNYPNSQPPKNLNVETSRPAASPDPYTRHHTTSFFVASWFTTGKGGTAVPRLGDLSKTPQNLVRLAMPLQPQNNLFQNSRAKAMDFILWSPPNICKTRKIMRKVRESQGWNLLMFEVPPKKVLLIFVRGFLSRISLKNAQRIVVCWSFWTNSPGWNMNWFFSSITSWDIEWMYHGIMVWLGIHTSQVFFLFRKEVFQSSTKRDPLHDYIARRSTNESLEKKNHGCTTVKTPFFVTLFFFKKNMVH